MLLAKACPSKLCAFLDLLVYSAASSCLSVNVAGSVLGAGRTI